MAGKGKRIAKALIRFTILIALMAAATFSVYKFFASREKVRYAPPIAPVQVALPERVILNDNLTLSSYVEAEAMIPIVPFVSGTIKEYYAVAGESVKEGEVVAVIDQAPFILQVSQAKAAYTVYQSTYERLAELAKTGAATAQQLDEIKAQADAAKAQLELAELQLSYATVTSPVDGRYLLAGKAVGDIGSQTSPLAVVANLDDLVVNIHVPEKYFSAIRGNENIRVAIRRPSSSVSSEVNAKTEIISISPYIDPTTKTFVVKVKLLDNIASFTPGMYVLCDIVLSSSEAYALPINARKLDGSVYSIVEESDGGYRAQYHDFSSALSDGAYFEVGEQFKDTYFIVRGQNTILSGQSVKVVEGF